MIDRTDVEHRVTGYLGARGRWLLTLGEEGLSLRPAKGPGASIEVPREEVRSRTVLREHALGGPLLQVRTPRIVMFRLPRTVTEEVREWRGPMTLGELREALRRSLVWAVPIGLLYVLTALPLPAAGDLEALPVDAFALALGAALLGLALLRWIRPSRTIFLLDAAWFAALTVDYVRAIVTGVSGLGWLAGVPFLMLAVHGAIQEYRRFPPDDRLV